jgi:hypothetical protein
LNRLSLFTPESNLRFDVEKHSLPRALIATHHLVHYAGSEILTLELALELRSMGWDVTVAAILTGAPMLQEFRGQQIPLFELLAPQPAFATYVFDLVWVQHAPVFYELFLTHQVQALRIVYCSLSHFEPLESIPDERSNIDALLAHSEENRQHLIRTQQLHPEAVTVFPNAVPTSYLGHLVPQHPSSPRRIAFISNHLPPELLEAKLLLMEQGLEVDHLGMGGKPILVQAELLLSYDIVISIGKTIPYCLALEIPAYCYDHFGGPGWLQPACLSLAQHHNFSGRGFSRKTGTDICQELLSGYALALLTLTSLRRYAEDYLQLRKNLLQLMTYLPTHSKPHERLHVTPSLERQHASYMALARKLAATSQSFEACDCEVRRIKSTLSWRITKPLRLMAYLVRCIRSALQFRL